MDSTFTFFGYDLDLWVATILSLMILVAIYLFTWLIGRNLILRLCRALLNLTPFGRDNGVSLGEIVSRLVHILPVMVLSIGTPMVPGLPAPVVSVIVNVANATIVLLLAMSFAAALSVVDTIYSRRPAARMRPIKGFLQVGKIAIFIIAGLLVVATILDRSPLILLSGLGAMAAVLMLVFQDTILAFVAGIQISSTGMVRMGDWIEMPSLGADGDVIEISLHTVTVQNWDKTITTIPIRKLVTESFKNWRGMQESGGRRIKRAIYIDQATIRFLDDAECERMLGFSQLSNYIESRTADIERWNTDLGDKANVPINTRRMTNIGTFRAYVENYLKSHPGINQNMTMIVRQMAPGSTGIPIEIYCFTNTTSWVPYESIQSDIFDHLYAVLPEFGLRVFQQPTGWDLQESLGRKALAS